MAMIREEIKALQARTNKAELRKFGRTMGIFFALVAAFLYWRESSATVYVAGVAAAFLLFGLVLPAILRPVYIGWMSFAIVMGFYMSRLILTLLFYLVLTPMGFFMRVTGKDPLNERIDKGASSYWTRRERKPFDPVTAEKQY